MTTINDITDLLRILNEQPEWADQVRAALLGQRFLELPDRLDALSKAVEELAVTVREMSLAFDRRLTRLEEDMVEVKADVVVLNSDMVEVKAGVARIEDKMDRHDRIFATQGGQLAHLRGYDYEGLAAEPARRKIRDALGLSRLTIFSQHIQQGAIKLRDLTHEAELTGVMSDDDQADLSNADIVFAGTDQGESVFVVAEISITVELYDVERAAHRASLLHQATGVPALAAVIGAGIDAAAAREADTNSVAFAQISEEEAESYRR